jgi:hypothetical protein
MRIGLDLDGTLIIYDDVFHRHGVERFGVPVEVPHTKTAVRDWLRANAPGEKGWIELQRIVYGLRIAEARPAPGAEAFLDDCRRAGIAVSIISHKTRLSVAAPPIDLHAAALDWLYRRAFFGLGLDPDRVFFEPTRAAKLERIAAEGCVLFVDDLEEVFAEPAFPAGVERWLYAPQRRPEAPAGVTVFADWREVSRRAHELLEAPAAR